MLAGLLCVLVALVVGVACGCLLVGSCGLLC